jgi:hypothetical protein
MMSAIPDIAAAGRHNEDGTVLHIQLQGELDGFTLAAHPRLLTLSLLHNLQGSPRMLREELCGPAEFALLLPLLLAYPGALTVAAPGLSQPSAGALGQKLDALCCELVFRDGCVLQPRNRFHPARPEEADELLPCTVAGVAPEGAQWVANQRLCTLAVLTAGRGGTACMEWEDQLSARQMAILLTLLDRPGVLLSEVYGEYLQADVLYGEQWMERDDRLDRTLERRFAGLPGEEQRHFEQVVWREIEGMRPLCERLGFSIRRETSYLLHPLSGMQG